MSRSMVSLGELTKAIANTAVALKELPNEAGLSAARGRLKHAADLMSISLLTMADSITSTEEESTGREDEPGAANG